MYQARPSALRPGEHAAETIDREGKAMNPSKERSTSRLPEPAPIDADNRRLAQRILGSGQGARTTVVVVGDLTNGDLVRAAATGSEPAWEALVDRFATLVWSVTRTYRLDHHTAKDVSQEVWSRLAFHIETIREPDRIAGWLATTARREAQRAGMRADRERPTTAPDHLSCVDPDPAIVGVLRAEEDRAVLASFDRLDDRCRLLLRLLFAEPKLTYEEIGDTIGVPIGSIGPTRARCLAKLQRELEAEAYE
jgi:RNA polymerase sigma factor (sigma-70 family)